jgi:hypothetical protein
MIEIRIQSFPLSVLGSKQNDRQCVEVVMQSLYIRATIGRKEKGNKSVHPAQNYVQVKEARPQVPRKRKRNLEAERKDDAPNHKDT